MPDSCSIGLLLTEDRIGPTTERVFMKIQSASWVILVAGLFIGCASDQQAKLEAKAKIRKAEAEKIALAQAPNGTIKEGELEKEKGRLIWSFDIATPGSKDITEVAVDAVNGQVLGVTKETAKEEEKEKQAESK
jgi:hypothetical protein